MTQSKVTQSDPLPLKDEPEVLGTFVLVVERLGTTPESVEGNKVRYVVTGCRSDSPDVDYRATGVDLGKTLESCVLRILSDHMPLNATVVGTGVVEVGSMDELGKAILDQARRQFDERLGELPAERVASEDTQGPAGEEGDGGLQRRGTHADEPEGGQPVSGQGSAPEPA